MGRGNILSLVMLAAVGYVVYEMYGKGQSLGTALTFGGMLPKIPGLTGLGCPGCTPQAGLGYIVRSAYGVYSGYAPTGSSSLPTKTERAYAARSY